MSQSRVKALSSRVRVNAPANSFRGGWVDTFRSTVLTQLLANINQQGSSAGWTYIDYAAGPDKWDISQSVRRQWGINPVFDYGRAMSVLRHKDERAFMGHPFLGLMRRVREVNSDVVANSKALGDRTTVSKLVPGFKYFPSTAALLKPIMREQDRAILCEKDPEYFHVSTYCTHTRNNLPAAFDEDRRARCTGQLQRSAARCTAHFPQMASLCSLFCVLMFRCLFFSVFLCSFVCPASCHVRW